MKRKNMSKKKLYLGFLLTSLLFSACGGENGTNSEDNPSSEGNANAGGVTVDADYVVDAYGNLPKCNENKEGQIGFVSGVSKLYVCEDGEWVLETSNAEGESSGNKGSSSSVKESSSSNENSSSGNESPVSNSSSSDEGADSEENSTEGVLIDERDGRTYKYKTVVIGSQIWMAENLNFSADGSVCYDNNPVNCEKYGRLYTWDLADKVCPKGWHLPSKEEFDELLDKVKSASSLTSSEWIEGEDSFGFSALPAGRYDSRNESTYRLGGEAYFWSSTLFATFSSSGVPQLTEAYYLSIDVYRNIYGVNAKASVGRWFRSDGFSVRCVKDKSDGDL